MNAPKGSPRMDKTFEAFALHSLVTRGMSMPQSTESRKGSPS